MRATLYFDGCTKPSNPGPSAGAAVLTQVRPLSISDDSEGVPTQTPIYGEVFYGTNNVAEYQGLLVGLKYAKSVGIQHIHVYGDSKLVVEQVCGRWKCKKAHLKPLVAEAQELLRSFYSWTLEWIPREQNEAADAASNVAIDRVMMQGMR